MVQINFARKEINCKLVYYGPGLSGKTTNLEQVHERTPEQSKGELTSISTDGDRTLFFDFMPLDLGEIAGMKTKFHLYTVPGQVYYNSTRKLVLLGADGVIFIADSAPDKIEENRESLENLAENLLEAGKDLSKFPLVIQWNKRDVEGALPVEELEKELNCYGAPTFEAIAAKGDGVYQTLKSLSALVLKSINSTKSSLGRSAPPTVGEGEAVKDTDAATSSDEPLAATIPSSADPPPALGGFVLERGEVVTGEAKPSSEEVADNAGPTAAPPPMPALDSPAARPDVASNPLEEVVASAKPPQVAAAPSAIPAAAPVAVMVSPAPASAPAASVEELVAKAPSVPRSDESFTREVRVIGGRKDGAQRPRDHRAMVTGLLVGVGIAVAGAAVWFFVLS